MKMCHFRLNAKVLLIVIMYLMLIISYPCYYEYNKSIPTHITLVNYISFNADYSKLIKECSFMSKY